MTPTGTSLSGTNTADRPAQRPREARADALAMLERHQVITTDPADVRCCGLQRSPDGFCSNRNYHPIYVGTFVGPIAAR